jgi:hypothetical protein
MIDIFIDELTNSIIEVATGNIFETVITEATTDDLKDISGWNFNWMKERRLRVVYKLTTVDDPTTIHGLISWELQQGFLYTTLLENAPFNIGKDRQIFKGVAGNLVAFACKISFEKGFGGYIAFDAKTQLIEHYQKTLGAKLIRGQRMFIETNEALILVKRYFKNF